MKEIHWPEEVTGLIILLSGKKFRNQTNIPKILFLINIVLLLAIKVIHSLASVNRSCMFSEVNC